ncbi:hypothetical protein SCLCIDRAFT_1221688 [Scleroderma citrinum Foug A]|uniref:Uncharacterized protein n=1 Tax=Scleroderma citrinum Foug A TaxID=1036808 RepID=A0A0C3DEG6_9AGAM|nr:hypothetical protein SCLCIDRAFT_1221688 [Scleroderma citrinum Foug A]
MTARIAASTGGKTQFLTIQALTGSSLCIVLSLVQDLFPSVERYLHPSKRALLMIFLPTGFTVCSIYWPLRIFAPSLIFLPDTTPTTTPDLFASAAAASAEPVFSGLATGRDLVYIPLFADLSMHAAPFIALMLDFFLCERKFSRRQLNRVAPVIMLAYGTIYGSALEYLAKCDGYFTYPFLDVSPFSVRLAIYVGAACGGYTCLRLLNGLRSL